MTARVVIVEDHALLAQSLGLALRAEGLTVEIAQLDSRERLLAQVAAGPPALVLLDLDLGRRLGDGTDLIGPLVDAGNVVLVVSGIADRYRLAATVEAGAVGFVHKSAPFETLLDRALVAAAGQPVLAPGERDDLLTELRRYRSEQARLLIPLQRLSERERNVLVALGEGKSVEAIARERFVSEATVRTQVRAVLTKLDVKSQLAAVAKARTAGWL
ncbi:response regulator transcription factor [Planosporangium thailandense]|uniref:Response regulator transcription factor n=1 Tax=Planosporangium thailandense TaxID=765197 RepID=A0ABX0XYE6_9ACTN|nr:response regulator transcription factor [Planosporangium thailandense]NJC71085.1 response regulator transcription factor [Planosporangium thailandense]